MPLLLLLQLPLPLPLPPLLPPPLN